MAHDGDVEVRPVRQRGIVEVVSRLAPLAEAVIGQPHPALGVLHTTPSMPGVSRPAFCWSPGGPRAVLRMWSEPELLQVLDLPSLPGMPRHGRCGPAIASRRPPSRPIDLGPSRLSAFTGQFGL